ETVAHEVVHLIFLAHDAPENQVDDLMRHRLTAMFKPTRKTAYDDVLPFPRIEDVADRVRRGRVLLIVSPDAKIPPEEVQKFFEGLSQQNNGSLVFSGVKNYCIINYLCQQIDVSIS